MTEMAEKDFPIIDITNISHPDHQLSLAREIAKASETWGSLLLKNHPIPESHVDQMFSLAHDFFVDTPEEQKAPYPIDDSYTGYIGSFNDGPRDDKASMWFSGRPGDLVHKTSSLPLFWRDHIEQVDAFKHECHKLVTQLLVWFAIAMDLPSDYFSAAHDEYAGNGTRFRMICYPARSQTPSQQTQRMSAHSDSGSVTLLFQTCGGLEVQSPTGAWVEAPYLPGHILVNLGDALAFWSGARLKATKHRVTFDTVPHDKERLTMAYFAAATPDTVLEPLRDGADGTKLEGYNVNGVVIRPGITVGEYETKIMESIYGKRTQAAKT